MDVQAAQNGTAREPLPMVPALQVLRKPLAPGPDTLDAMKLVLELRKSPVQWMRALHQKYGDIVRFQIGGTCLHLLFEPADVKYVIETNADNYSRHPYEFETLRPFVGKGFAANERPLWAMQRHAFDGHATENLVDALRFETESMLDQRWERYARDGQAFDVVREMGRILLKGFARANFDVTLSDEDVDAIDHAGRTTVSWASRRTVTRVPRSWPTPANRRLSAALRPLDVVFRRIIDERRRAMSNDGDRVRHDFLSRIVAARDPKTGQPLPDDLLRDLVAGVIGPSFVNTMFSQSWIWYRLSLHPDVRARVEQELSEVLGGKAPTFDQLRLLTYTRMAIQEALRVHPSAYAISRQAIGEDEVHGYHIPAGSAMVAPQYHIHRHPKYWENPEGFDPERFTPERSADRPTYAYFPFGGGHFKCIAREMSMAELTLITATVAQRFRIDLVSDHAVTVDERWMLLAPRNGIVVTLRRGGHA